MDGILTSSPQVGIKETCREDGPLVGANEKPTFVKEPLLGQEDVNKERETTLICSSATY